MNTYTNVTWANFVLKNSFRVDNSNGSDMLSYDKLKSFNDNVGVVNRNDGFGTKVKLSNSLVDIIVGQLLRKELDEV